MTTNVIRAQLVLAMLAILAPKSAAQQLWFSDGGMPQAASDSELQQAAMEAESVPMDMSMPSGEVVHDGGAYRGECDHGAPYGDCGPYGNYCECGPNSGYCECDSQPSNHLYADLELMFFRAHFSEIVLGKLSEQYDLSPRFVMGYENQCGLGARARYWHYDHTTPNNQIGPDLGLEFDVIDLEGTHRISRGRTELIVAGGFRWADIQIDVDDERSRNDMPGATFAADLRSAVCCKGGLEWAAVGGVRWTILGGDWEGSNNGLIEPSRDDNLTVEEIYGGFECRRRGCKSDLYARLVFEIQNWRSDALGASTDVDSLSFLGPGFQLGISR